MKYFIIALLLLPTLGFSQKCNLSKDRVDDFTGEVVKETRAKKLEYPLVNHHKCEDCFFTAQVGFRRVGSTTMLRLDMIARSVFSIKERALIQFKFDDGEIIDTFTPYYEMAEYRKVGGLENTPWNASVYCVLDEALINKLKSVELSKVRVHFSDGHGSAIVRNSKSARKIQDYLLCVLE